jgi:hypothetical protein
MRDARLASSGGGWAGGLWVAQIAESIHHPSFSIYSGNVVCLQLRGLDVRRTLLAVLIEDEHVHL